MEGVTAAANFIFGVIDAVWQLSSGTILMLPIALWMLDRVVNIFDVLKH